MPELHGCAVLGVLPSFDKFTPLGSLYLLGEYKEPLVILEIPTVPRRGCHAFDLDI